MPRQSEHAQSLSQKSALVIGVGGLGCPALLALARSGIGRVVLADDDEVSLSNLHRQLLFDPEDVGKDKVTRAAQKLGELDAELTVELVHSRFLPDNALELARSVDVLVEGADNFATKFLAADAARLTGRPVIHGSGVRWTTTVFSVGRAGRPCYRCLFEDVPPADVGQNCDEAGVMGPVLGMAGALMADLALSSLLGSSDRQGSIFTYDGKLDRLRRVAVTDRGDCPLCGPRPSIVDINEARYLAPNCAITQGAPPPNSRREDPWR
ncbi:MAG TPA: HesA/MoeB/ThiF family protein [Polyangiaceae bacterium]|nr:HesA/MoeB/ThiF family protein [Polyangiaceae bacterium]